MLSITSLVWYFRDGCGEVEVRGMAGDDDTERAFSIIGSPRAFMFKVPPF